MEPILVMLFWLGQGAFVIDTGELRILTDPYDAKLGYEVKTVEGVDVVTISHEHFDHNNAAMAAGKPLVLRGLADGGKQFAHIDQTVKGLRIRTVDSYHDAEQGAKRGRNAIFIFEVTSTSPTVRVVHMGDFGEKRLSAEQAKAIGPVDVLLLPVGGNFTIDAVQAHQVVAELKPKIVVPMHWKTDKTARLPITDAEPFLAGRENVLRGGPVSGNRLAVTSSLLQKAERAQGPLIVPLEYGPAPEARKP